MQFSILHESILKLSSFTVAVPELVVASRSSQLVKFLIRHPSNSWVPPPLFAPCKKRASASEPKFSNTQFLNLSLVFVPPVNETIASAAPVYLK